MNPATGKQTSAMQDLNRGIWRENPVLVQMLGLCPALAVTNSLANALAMSAATCFVLFFSSLLVSLCKHWIPHQVRISTYILIIATFVTLADMLLESLVPVLHADLGAFIALIVANCMILGRQESFASKRPVGRACIDALSTSAGFTVALVMIGGLREILGSGSLLGFSLFGPNFEPWVVMVLPAGGFFAMAFILLGIGAWERRRQQRAEPAPATRANA